MPDFAKELVCEHLCLFWNVQAADIARLAEEFPGSGMPLKAV